MGVFIAADERERGFQKGGKKSTCNTDEQAFRSKAYKALKFVHNYCANKNQGSCIYRKELAFRVKDLGIKGVFKYYKIVKNWCVL